MRNIVDDVAVNIKFDLYSPLIQSIQVLKLEKWSDSNLRYLMSCDAYYCTIPFDMMPGKVIIVQINLLDGAGLRFLSIKPPKPIRPSAEKIHVK